MKIQYLEPTVAIADALTPADLDEVKAQGFRSVICNRRPGEADDYPGADAFEQRARALGLAWCCVPVAPGEYSEADIEAFGQALEQSPSPVLAFCRTGRRAVHLWAQSRARQPGCDIPGLLAKAHEAGHDPQPIRAMIEG
ncbi:TIGR01244 family sulfur transferase [Marinobacter xestospongiae]|uniref:TIGR01244 family sulfur transferase n=1 Tax=Marinobacter xestospongiae TaxID=994319 RepID=A0ABU3VVM0_9GAMM|nr:TIGR01244 family sulfur transferase [Marinobacter xestospongiae]MCG8519127.1 TIGR01244 family sulfur transferase [Pseudomonadales bacterium]MCK7567773.1 TIGR01244 family sulfur transferase [Marinobacter xestospongiae]MDV2078330.1 TIGR01244 family sulfur transferase [Marinobacter xestospongiae]